MVSSGNWNFKLKFQLVEEDFSQWSEALTRPGFCYLWSKLFLLCDCFCYFGSCVCCFCELQVLTATCVQCGPVANSTIFKCQVVRLSSRPPRHERLSVCIQCVFLLELWLHTRYYV